MSSSKLSTATKVFIIIAIWFAGLSVFLFVERDTVPLLYAEIPDSTIDFFERMINEGSDFVMKYKENPDPDEWNNKDKYGDDKDANFKKLEDENFIIFYKDNAKGLEKAKFTLESVNRAIPRLTEVFGKYFYAKDVNGDKLCIYVTQNIDQYQKTITQLIGSECSRALAEGSAGITISSYSVYGVKTEGIVISPKAWKFSDKNTVITHEMAHYVHFHSLPLDKQSPELIWYYEGVAEFAANNLERMKEKSNRIIEQFNLESNAESFSDNYWLGLSIYLFMEQKCQNSCITQYLNTTYTQPVISTLEATMKLPLDQFEKEWREFALQY